MNRTLQQIQDFLRGLTLSQKALLAGGAVAVGLTLWLFVSLIDHGKNVVLYTGLKPADAQAMGARLAAKNIPYDISPDGTSLLVPPEKLDAARLETASQGLPRNARLGFELFDTPNWAGSDFSEKVNYQRALEGELERTLQTLAEVEAVRVHLVLPRESLFTEEERASKAAVIIKTRGGSLSKEAQQAIPQLVASAVDGLKPENVTVVDAETATPFLSRRGPSGRASFDADDELAAAAVHAIEPVVGAEHVRASVHVDYDLSSSEDTSEIYDPKAAATLMQQHSEELAGGGSPAGVPGVASNVPASTTAVPPIPSVIDNQSSKNESTTFAVSKNTRHTINPAGRVRRITASVLIDDAFDPPGEKSDNKLDAKSDNKSDNKTDNKADNKSSATPVAAKTDTASPPNGVRRKRTPEELAAIEKLARAAIGVDEQRGDLLVVENLSFQSLPVESVPPLGKFERWRLLLLPWLGALRYVGITLLFLLVYAMVLNPVKKQAIAAFRQIPDKLGQSLAGAGANSAAAMIGLDLGAGTDEAKKVSALKKELAEKIKAEPAAASRLVETWIRDKKK